MKTTPATLLRSTCLATAALACSLTLFAQSGPPDAIPDQVLQPGDVVKISFPDTPNLDTTQQVRRDGKLNLPTLGEVRAADRTPADFEAELRRAYAPHLRSSEVTVTVVSSTFTVFVTGAVIRPGRINPERAITAFDAVMEAGGFDRTKANLRKVTIIRTVNGRVQRTILDLKAVLEGHDTTPFYLQPHDVVYVPERLVWF